MCLAERGRISRAETYIGPAARSTSRCNVGPWSSGICLASLIENCKLNGVNPQVLARGEPAATLIPLCVEGSRNIAYGVSARTRGALVALPARLSVVSSGSC
jgi:hypothetical protein